MKINILIFFLFIFLITGCRTNQKEQEKLPNIVFILADDMGYGDPGCYNAESRIPTPNIDKLADEGIMFTDAHSPGVWCVPSRYGLMTGCYPGRIDLNWRQRALIADNQETLATLLKRHGYSTAVIGKWHLGFDNINWENPSKINELEGSPVEKGFDYFFGMHASLDIPPYFYIENNKVVEPVTDSVPDNSSADATTPVSGAFWRGGACSPGFKHADVLDVFTQKAKNFINEQKEKPFFLYFALPAPHTPWLPKAEFVGKSGAGEYGDYVMQVDDVVGEIIKVLEGNGIRNETLVFFSSDNGPVWFERDVQKFEHDASGGLKGMKIDFWEGGSRIPFIATWPGKIMENVKSDKLICFTDMMATFSELTNDTIFSTTQFDSYSILPLLINNNSKERIREELVIEDRIYRQGEWKYIDGTGLGGLTGRHDPDKVYLDEANNEGELYNLSNDLSEQNNLYEKGHEKVILLKKKLRNTLNNEN